MLVGTYYLHLLLANPSAQTTLLYINIAIYNCTS
jgi:hypothetical protein